MIEQRYGVRLNPSHVSFWTRGIHRPDGRIRNIPLHSPELAYVVGALKSDGAVAKKSKGQYELLLTARDREFQDAFVAKVQALGLKPFFTSRGPAFISWRVYQIVKKNLWIRLFTERQQKNRVSEGFLRW